MRIALIGGTGLIGALVADRLLEAGHEVHALVRRPTGRDAAGWNEHVAPAGRWPEIVTGLAPDAAMSAIGTTMRQAGSKAAFRAIDHDALTDFARAARRGGARRLAIVSSVSADAGSRNFYLRVKGEAEEALRALGLERLDIMRPGLLRGPREGTPRPGERLALLLSPVSDLVLRGPLDRYATIDAAVVADAMVASLDQSGVGSFIHENRAIHRWAGR